MDPSKDHFIVPSSAKEALGGAGLLLGAAAVGVGGAAVLEAAIAASPWALPAFQRGLDIEDKLGGNLPNGFPTIDRFQNGVATSIKSMDLAARSYQSEGAVLSRLNGYINSLSNFSSASRMGVSVNSSQIQQRVLNVAIPASGMTPAQAAAFGKAATRATSLGVTLTTTVIR